MFPETVYVPERPEGRTVTSGGRRGRVGKEFLEPSGPHVSPTRKTSLYAETPGVVEQPDPRRGRFSSLLSHLSVSCLCSVSCPFFNFCFLF